MNDAIGYLVSIIIAGVFMIFPGVLFIGNNKSLTGVSKIAATIYLSLGFWVCISWFISLPGWPLSYCFGLLQVIFIGYSIVTKRFGKSDVALNPLRWKGSDHVLLLSVLLLLFPVLFITIPPGCDTAMHGYIARLVVNNNGLPHSYRPILPVDYFGSYSAGYHVLTALIAGFKVALLRQAVILIALIVYPITLLAMVFLFRNFFSEQTAVFTAIIFFALNNSLQGTIGWGGNPSMLSFGFCLFTAGLVVHAVMHKERALLYMCSLAAASILLIHAIPAITFGYIALPGAVLLLVLFKNDIKWIVPNVIVFAICTLVLLLPFLVHFKNDSSPELTAMIKNWQSEMMGKKLTTGFAANIAVVADQIKYRVSDVMVILCGAALVGLLVLKQFKPVLIITGMVLYVFVLIFNCAYWFLPLSELLYPERVVYFMVVCLAFYGGYLLNALEVNVFTISVSRYKISAYAFVVTALLVYSGVRLFNGSKDLLDKDRLSCNKQTVEAFDWINHNTEENAVFRCNYGDMGMWIPTFTNRATAGTHMHFIHIVAHIHDTIEAMPVPRYFFVTRRDVEKGIWNADTLALHNKIFSNREVAIYR